MKISTNIHPMDELHNKAMDLASMAYSAKRKGKKVDLQQLYLDAFEYEKAAAMLLVNDYSMEPTRAVYFRSAASLLLCLPDLRRSDYEEAERMIALGLSGNPHPEIADELREVRRQLEQKYNQQLWEREFLTNGKDFAKKGFFTAINLKTLEFEFKVTGGEI